METKIDPQDWTVPELLKHVYREVMLLKDDTTVIKSELVSARSFYEKELNRINDLFRRDIERLNQDITIINTERKLEKEQQSTIVSKLRNNIKIWISILSIVIPLIMGFIFYILDKV